MAEMEFLDDYQPFNEEERSLVQQKDKRMEDLNSVDELSELEKLKKEVMMLEESVQQQEMKSGQKGGVLSQPKANWPSFYPIAYFDITDVPDEHQVYVREAFTNWFLCSAALVMNWITSVCLLATGTALKSPGSKISLATLYMVILVPISLDLNNLSIYRALRNKISTFTYIKIFLSLGFSFLFLLMLSIGSESSGGQGIITSLTLFTSGCIGTGVMSSITSVLLVLSCMFTFKLLMRLWSFYRGTEEGENMETDVKKSVTGYVIEKLTKAEGVSIV